MQTETPRFRVLFNTEDKTAYFGIYEMSYDGEGNIIKISDPVTLSEAAGSSIELLAIEAILFYDITPDSLVAEMSCMGCADKIECAATFTLEEIVTIYTDKADADDEDECVDCPDKDDCDIADMDADEVDQALGELIDEIMDGDTKPEPEPEPEQCIICKNCEIYAAAFSGSEIEACYDCDMCEGCRGCEDEEEDNESRAEYYSSICPDCEGEGVTWEIRGNPRNPLSCDACGGTGRILPAEKSTEPVEPISGKITITVTEKDSSLSHSEWIRAQTEVRKVAHVQLDEALNKLFQK